MGTAVVLWVKFMGVVMVFKLLAPTILQAFSAAQQGKYLDQIIIPLTLAFVAMIMLAGMAFNDPPNWMVRV